MHWLLPITLALAAAEPGVDITAVLEPPETPFHRPARYTVTVTCPEDLAPRLPEPPGDIENLEVQARAVQSESLGNGRKRLERTYLLDPIAPGLYDLPAAEVTWGEDQSATAPPLVLRARELTGAEEKALASMRGIRGPLSVAPEPGWGYWGVAAAAAGALLLLAVLAYAYRRRARPEAAPMPLMPWEKAEQRLQELAQQDLPAKGRYGKYYVDLSAILRYYIEDRFHLHAPEQTTPEFLDEALKVKWFDADQKAFLERFLRHCDRVKFARHEPDAEEMERNFEQVRQFVKDTTPKPAESGEQEVAA